MFDRFERVITQRRRTRKRTECGIVNSYLVSETHHRAIEIRMNGPRVERRFSTTGGGEVDSSGISELLRLLVASIGADDALGLPVISLVDGANSLLRRLTVPHSDLQQPQDISLLLSPEKNEQTSFRRTKSAVSVPELEKLDAVH